MCHHSPASGLEGSLGAHCDLQNDFRIGLSGEVDQGGLVHIGWTLVLDGLCPLPRLVDRRFAGKNV